MSDVERVKEQASAWAQAVGSWVGDSPYKAATFGGAVLVIGVVLGALVW